MRLEAQADQLREKLSAAERAAEGAEAERRSASGMAEAADRRLQSAEEDLAAPPK
ncbi:MAG TPA: hypothetical protein VGK17_17295 [Propionicimonas sp.]